MAEEERFDREVGAGAPDAARRASMRREDAGVKGHAMMSHAGQMANCPACYIIGCPKTAVPLVSGDGRSVRRIIGRPSPKGKITSKSHTISHQACLY